MYRFFSSQEDIHNRRLNKEEARHAIKVLRLGVNSLIEITDGQGHAYKAEITSVNKDDCSFNILDKKDIPESPSPAIHLVIAPPKSNDRMEWFLEKATEIGISSITPVICTRSERKKIKPERLEKIIVAAVKQSQRYWLPRLNELKTLEEFIKHPDNLNFDGNKMIATCYGERKDIRNHYVAGEQAMILIGPEGDFTQQEIDLAVKNNFSPVTFGDYRLRTETAALYACQAINLIN